MASAIAAMTDHKPHDSSSCCRFCSCVDEVIAAGVHFTAIYDRFPVNEGHVLIISKRHVETMLDLRPAEFGELHSLIHQICSMLDERLEPDGYNIGANCGSASGQTIPHFHLHVIPRFVGDVENPRGGVRNLKPPLVPY